MSTKPPPTETTPAPKKIAPHWLRLAEVLFVILLIFPVRLLSLNVFRAIDEEDRWAWAVDFYTALLAGDLPATLIGDGYPGVFPAWIETIWLFTATLYRSVLEGGWIGEVGINYLFHEWGRLENLWLQRFPIVLTNALLILLIYWYVRRLFGLRVALVSLVLLSLDPFILSDSRVNRAEALVTSLMAISALSLLLHLRQNSRRHLLISALFGGLACLTKLQAIVLWPMFGVMTLLWHFRHQLEWQPALITWLKLMLTWSVGVGATFVILWPAAWTVPVDTFNLMYGFLTRKVGDEGVNIFFLGRPYLDEDPGLLFYPVIFLLRITPLTLLGLLLGLAMVIKNFHPRQNWRTWVDEQGMWFLLLYASFYVAGMSLGGHKQDRFLMVIFPMLAILAAIAYVRAAQKLPENRWFLAGGLFLSLQLLTVLPYHPYYFSYFNPLMGGSYTAPYLTRIGWGEGMDQVADYLNTLDSPEELVVSTRFTKYLLGFQGEIINLAMGDGWERGDKIIFYIQQAQRLQDPSEGVIRYFERHVTPEHIVRLNGIDYAWVYPNPIHHAANSVEHRLDGRIALFGYRWDDSPSGGTATLIWENLSGQNEPVSIRVWSSETRRSDWLTCTPAPGFEEATQTIGAVVESRCLVDSSALPGGLYDLQVGLADVPREFIDFPAGRAVLEREPDGRILRLPSVEAFARLAAQALPPTATLLEHTFHDTYRLLGYQIDPTPLRPGQSVRVNLYWQRIGLEPPRTAQVSLQLFQDDHRLLNRTGIPAEGSRPVQGWELGEVIADPWTVTIPATITGPSLLRFDAGLFWQDTRVPLKVRNLAGQDIPNALEFTRLKPETWPSDPTATPVAAVFSETIRLNDYQLTQNETTLDVTLTWEALAVPPESYALFVHLLAPDGSLVTQSDVGPEYGRYPTDFWEVGDQPRSFHSLSLPAELPPGEYTLVTGLYRYGDFARLPVSTSNGWAVGENALILQTISWP